MDVPHGGAGHGEFGAACGDVGPTLLCSKCSKLRSVLYVLECRTCL